MKITQVLKKPIITEKTYKMMDLNKFVFVVDNQATKLEIKRSFEIIFDKKVDSVNLIKNKSKKRRVGRYLGKTKRVKKAVISLKEGEVFTLFSKEQEDKIKEVTAEIKSKVKDKSTKISDVKSKSKNESGALNKFKTYWKSFTTLDTKKTIKKQKKEDENK